MTQSISFTRLILSLGMIVFVGALVVGATGAFFSDTETSEGNVFAAGALDLKVDSVAHINGLVCFDDAWHPETVVEWDENLDPPQLVLTADQAGVDAAILAYNEANPANVPQAGEACASTWSLTDLGLEHIFFNYGDLKPGDQGENTISIHVETNDAYMCAIIENVEDLDNGQTEPELEAGDDDGLEGELDSELNFFIWEDDGDNIFEQEEIENVLVDGATGEGIEGVYELYTPATGALSGDETSYLGVYWCYGEFEVVGTDITCDGGPVTNMSQTDSLMADITFYVEQARNNDGFECPAIDEEPEGRPVGAALAAYAGPTPEECDINVDGAGGADHDTIQAAVDAATGGETICVADGDYDETVVIDTALTLASVNGPTNTATIMGGVQIDSSNVTVTGFVINPGDVPADPQNIGVFINGSYSNIDITFNDIEGDGSASRGILTTTGATYSDIFIENNEIHDVTTGIYLNPFTGDMMIRFNDIYENVAGIGGLNGAMVVANEFSHSLAAQEAIGVDSSYDANPASVTQNNFLDDTRLNTYTTITGPIDAEDNFWGPNGADAQVDDSNGTVDFDPEALVMFPHN